MTNVRILITGACGVTPRAIARSLHLSPIFRNAVLIGTDRGGNWYGFYEGLYDRVYLVPDTRDPRYAEVIDEVCRSERIDAAVVSPESEVRFWSERDFPAPTVLPPPRFVAVAVSKKRLYEYLCNSELIPRYTVISRQEILDRRGLDFAQGPLWLRDFSEASSSGIGSIRVGDPDEACSWAYLNPGIKDYMVAEYLPGRNFACNLLFQDDELLKVGCYERLDYFGGNLIPSGVSGNISRGRLVNDSRLPEVAEDAVRLISDQVGEPVHGLVTVDLKEASDNSPKVTEINVRHTAVTFALAAGGANLAEAQVLAALGRCREIGSVMVTFPDANVILRDIDGPPAVVTNGRQLEIGDFVDRAGSLGETIRLLDGGPSPRLST